jgi:AICAR transformylase/IMP cyclohydrolase PurH
MAGRSFGSHSAEFLRRWREQYAIKAFRATAEYDTMIANWMAKTYDEGKPLVPTEKTITPH